MRKEYADQDRPKDILHKKVKLKRDKQKLLCYQDILKRNGIDDVSLFNELASKGCSYSSVANSIIELYERFTDDTYDDEMFKQCFGFSLLSGDEIDYNILMIDLFSTLYNTSKINIHAYQNYSFSNPIEASLKLLNTRCSNDNEALIHLMNNGYSPNGKDKNGNNLYRKGPINMEFYGTYSEILYQLFGESKPNVTKDEFNKIITNNGWTYEENNKVEAKFSGLLKEDMNKWVNYYLSKKNTGFMFKSKFVNEKENLGLYIDDNCVVNVSVPPLTELPLYNLNGQLMTTIKTKNTGHQMNLLFETKDKNIIVNTWGTTFVIRNSDRDKLEYTAMKLEVIPQKQIKNKN